MNMVSQVSIIGIFDSRDWLDIHCLPDGNWWRRPNTRHGHALRAVLAGDLNALVCFEATGGQEWRLWTTLMQPVL